MSSSLIRISILIFIFCSHARAEEFHYWCVPNKPTEFTWKKEIIEPEITKVTIDPKIKLIKYEKEDGSLITEFKDKAEHETGNPKVGLVDRVYFNPDNTVVGVLQKIMAPGYYDSLPYLLKGGIAFNLNNMTIMGNSHNTYYVEQYCGKQNLRQSSALPWKDKKNARQTELPVQFFQIAMRPVRILLVDGSIVHSRTALCL